MNGFRFKFESVLTHRRSVEDQCQRELAQLLRTRMQLQQQISQMQKQIHDSKHAMSESLVGKVDMEQVAAFARYSGQTSSHARHLAHEMAQVEKRIAGSRAKLLEATKARKAMELLRDKHARAWRAERARRERLELDELATQRYLRGEPAEGGG